MNRRQPNKLWSLAALFLLAGLVYFTIFWPAISPYSPHAATPRLEDAPAFPTDSRILLLQKIQAAENAMCRSWETIETGGALASAIDALGGRVARFDRERIILGTAQVQRIEAADADGLLPAGELCKRALDRDWRLAHVELSNVSLAAPLSSTSVSVLTRLKAFATNVSNGQRAVLGGELELTWRPKAGPSGSGGDWTLAQIQIRSLSSVETAAGPMPFRLVYETELAPAVQSAFIDPLIAYYSGQSAEISFLALNAGKRIVCATNGLWRAESCTNWVQGVVTAAAALDASYMLQADSQGLWRSDMESRTPPVRVWTAPSRLKHPEVIALGDIDGDGDLDVWLVQYKAPYLGGQFPTPYFDANDGFSSFLLRNDGDAGYADIAISAGLGAKRLRRTYSASFIDLDGDGDLDLINVSDFAGLDVYLNNGHGHFEDVTERLGEAHFSFGMSHSFADWNRDGVPDIFVAGMDSPAASMLDSLGIETPVFPGYSWHRAVMSSGNRVFLSGKGGLQESPWSSHVAHSGWSWGSAVADFCNNGKSSIYLATGHETLPNSEDYEWQFWTHDIYAATSQNDPAAEKRFFRDATERYRRGISYGGWLANSLYAQVSSDQWADVGWLYGVAALSDCRNVVAEDFDSDGGMDLAVTTSELWPVRRQRLLVYHNEIPGRGNWIGFRFAWPATAPSLIGAKLILETETGPLTHWFVTGDSYRSQPSFSAHFGLGQSAKALSAELIWPNGRRKRLGGFQSGRWNIAEP